MEKSTLEFDTTTDEPKALQEKKTGGRNSMSKSLSRFLSQELTELTNREHTSNGKAAGECVDFTVLKYLSFFFLLLFVLFCFVFFCLG